MLTHIVGNTAECFNIYGSAQFTSIVSDSLFFCLFLFLLLSTVKILDNQQVLKGNQHYATRDEIHIYLFKPRVKATFNSN